MGCKITRPMKSKQSSCITVDENWPVDYPSSAYRLDDYYNDDDDDDDNIIIVIIKERWHTHNIFYYAAAGVECPTPPGLVGFPS